MSFSADQFLLHSDLAQELYHEVAAPQPVHDVCALMGSRSTKMTDSQLPLVQQWLGADPRLNLAFQRQQLYLSDKTSDEDAFLQWVEGLWHLAGSPWYLEAQLSLAHSFGVKDWLSPKTAKGIWEQVKAGLDDKGGVPKTLPLPGKLEQVHVLHDPAQLWEEQEDIARLRQRGTTILPTFCPDQVLALHHASRWNAYLSQLEKVAGSPLEHFIDLINVLQQQVDQLAAKGAKLAIHHIAELDGVPYTDEEVNFIFHKLRLRHPLTLLEQAKMRGALLYHLLEMYHEQSWVLYMTLGVVSADEGEALPHLLDDQPLLRRLFTQLDQWDQAGILPRLILNLPGRSKLAAHLIGYFPATQVRSCIDLSQPCLPQRLASQWADLLEAGLLADGVGMFSGAAHPMALVRHDYGRRVLCDWLATEITSGRLPGDRAWVEGIIRTWTNEGGMEWIGT